MRSKTLLTILPVFLFNFFQLNTHAQSCCDVDDVITLCYLSAADWCGTNDGNCFEYSLDGNHMENALALKLQSDQNFGPSGTVNCNLELKRLADVSSVQSINDCGCDMVFTINAFVGPGGVVDWDASFMPEYVLENIYNWSLECENNIAIIPQIEAYYWGYTLENANINPNTPVAGTSLNVIFDGPFGSLPSFNQGGGYQGVFTGTPASGTEILANDANGNATVALDIVTNDIMIGDIGIFCSNNVGDVSTGTGINNNNDILVCNIFALACRIAEGFNSERTIAICPNDTVTLPGGSIVSSTGIYVDSLISVGGCDSVITTEIIDRIIPPTNFINLGCENDGYNISINGNDYNENNPLGQEILTTSGGCDSMVLIDLIFNPATSAQTNISLCPGESYVMANGEIITEDGNYIDTLTNFKGCDSFLTFELINYFADTSYFNTEICPDDSVVVNGESFFAGSTYYFTETNQYGCDSLLVTDLILFPEPLVLIDSFAEVRNSDISPFKNNIPNIYEINWMPADILNCGDCPEPIVLSNDGITNFDINILDTNNCAWLYPVEVEYICNTYVPNAFSPNHDGFNDSFQLYNSGCPLENFQFHIFDRWGNNVFYTDDFKKGWNGTNKGKEAGIGVYVYQISYLAYGKKEFMEGDLVLIR